MSAAIAPAALLLVAVAGCSAGDPEAKPLSVAERASVITKAAGADVVHWAATVTNPNKSHFGEFPIARVRAMDDQGKVLAEREEPLNVVAPGGRVAVAGQLSVEGKPAKVDVSYEEATFRPAARNDSAFLEFPVTGAEFSKSGDAGYRVTGEVANPYNHPIEGMAVTALLRGAKGELIGGGTTHVDYIAGGVSRPFNVKVAGTVGTPKKVEVVPGTWGASYAHLEDLVGSGPYFPPPDKLEDEPFSVDRAKGHASAQAGR